jgi:hypothetical protein
MRPIFGTASLELKWWLLLAAFVPVVFLAEEGRKLVMRRLADDSSPEENTGSVAG